MNLLTKIMSLSLREENAQAVRERIAGAVAAHLAERGLDDLSLPIIARRAGVSVATMYRYYPSREALLDAYAEWVRAKIKVKSFDVSLEAWPDQIEHAFAAFDGIETAVRGQLAASSMPSFRHVRNQRLAAMKRTLAPVLAPLAEDDRKRALGAIGVLTGAHAWQLMKDDWGLTGREAGEAAAWAVTVLVQELTKKKSTRRTRDDARKR
jgi:AcrR family transcriptional regulator